MGEGQSTRRGSFLVRVIAAIVGLALFLLVGIHLAPVRSLVLRSVLPLAGQNLIVHVDRLDYNVFRLRATVTGVTIAATQTPDAPFFAADTVTVAAPPGILRGLIALSRVEITGGRLRIIRTSAGSNLPASSRVSTSEPGPLHLGHITADLAVDLRDEVAGYSLSFPRVSSDLSSNGGQMTSGSGRIVLRGQTINVTSMAGGASFDGRALTLQGMNLASDVANARLDGPLVVITRKPTLELRVNGAGNVARLTALATPARVFDGEVTFDGSLVGPFTEPVADLRVKSDRLARDKLALTSVDLMTRVDVKGAQISQSTFGLAGGRVDATANVAFDGSSSRVQGKWANVDLPSLLTALVERPPALLPAGPTSGTVTSDGMGFDLTRWTTAANMSLGAATNVRDRLAMPGESQLRMRAGAWRLDGQHRVGDVAPVGFALNGTVRSDGRVPLGGTVELTATQMSALAGVLTRVGLADLPPALLTGGTMTATSMIGGELERPTLKGTALLEGVRGDAYVLGPARVGFDAMPLDADVQLEAHADSAEVAGQAVTGVDASLRVRDAMVVLNSFAASEPATGDAVAAGSVRGSGTYQFNTRAYQIQTDVANWVWGGTPSVPAKGVVNLSFMGAGTIDRPAGDGRATVTDAFYRDLALGTITARASLDGQQATVDVDVPTLNARGHGQSELRAPYNATADVNVEALDLALLEPLVAKRDIPFRGMATAAAHAEGALSTWKDASVTVDLASAEGLLGDLAIALDGPAQVTFTSGTIGTTRLGARAGGLQAEVRGSLPIESASASSGAMTMTLIGDVGDLVTAARSTRLVDVPVVSGTGPVALLARVGGTVRAPEVSADVDLGPATLTAPDFPTVERVRLLGHVENGLADVREFSASVDGAEVTATASAPLSWASSSLPSPPSASSKAVLSASLKNVTARLLGRLAAGATVPDLEGSLDATVDLSSPTPDLSGLTGEARIDRLEVSAASVAITQAMPTRIVAQDGFARIASWDWTGEGTALSVTGQVRLSNLQTGILANGELDLRLLSPFLRSSGLATAGTLTPRISITGELNHPLIDGDIVLTDADMRLTSPRVFVSGLNGRAILSKDNLQIVSAAGSINGGDLKLGGTVSFPQGAPLTAELTADLTGMALEYPEGLRTEVDGSLVLGFKDAADGFDRVPVLSGSVHVVNGSYREPITVVGGLLSTLQSGVSAVPQSSSSDSSLAIALDVTVITDDDIVVDNNAATLALDADVRLIGTTAQPVLSGRAEVREGGRVLLGRNTYQVTAGTLDFANPNQIDPELNFQLVTRAGGHQIDVALTGTASSPMLALSSDETELAQSDLTSLLLTGRTVDKLGSADAALVGDVLVGNLSGEVGQVLGVAGRAVGIDAIRLGGIDDSVLSSDPSAIATETDPTSRLTFTKSLGSNVDVTFSQSLREGDQQTWVLEYLPSRRLLARLVADDQNLLTYEFRHDVQIGSGARTRSQAAAARRTTTRVSEVTITGTLPGQDIRNLLDLKEGSKFTFEALQDDRARVEDYYRGMGYLTVRVGARQTTSGEMVAVAFTIQPGPKTRLEVSGEPLSKEILEAVSQVWADSIAGPLLVDEARTLVLDRLAEEGYLQAKVDARIADVDGVQVLTLAAERGQRTTDVSIVIDGVSDELRDELSQQLYVEDLVSLAPRNTQKVSDSLKQALRDKGYLQPNIAIDTPTFTGEMAVVTVHIQSGDQVLLGPVTVIGSTLPIEKVRQALDFTEGLSYLQAAVDNAPRHLTTFYRQEGYPEVKVMVQPAQKPTNGAIGVTVTVDEGPRQVIKTVRVEGLRRIDEDVAQRAMALKTGQAARSEDILRARTRLFATGLFRRVDVASMPDEESPASPNEVSMRIVATVEEWPALRFRYGIQLAQERPEDETGRSTLIPGLSADVLRRTIFGRAVSIGGAAVVQKRSRGLGRVFITAPTFMSRPIRSSLVFQQQREPFAGSSAFVSDVRRISWEQRVKTLTHLDLSYAYKLEQDHFFETHPNPAFPIFDVRTRIARLTTTATWDSRNDPAVPVRGSLFSSSVEYSPKSLGSQIRSIRYFVQGRHFRPLGKTKIVFATAFRYGQVNPLGDQEVISSERFRTGGGTSIRGLPEDGAGAHDFFGLPVGGRVLVLFNEELRIPLHRWFQGVTFLDSGNIFKTPGDTSLGDLTTSVGVGLRVVTPFALLRVDYGQLVKNNEGRTGGRWIFGIGHTF